MFTRCWQHACACALSNSASQDSTASTAQTTRAALAAAAHHAWWRHLLLQRRLVHFELVPQGVLVHAALVRKDGCIHKRLRQAGHTGDTPQGRQLLLVAVCLASAVVVLPAAKHMQALDHRTALT